MRNHDENKDIRLVSAKVKVDFSNKTLQAPKSAIIGIRTWGRIDYLCNYCGWTFIWNNSIGVARKIVASSDDNTKSRKREAKKLAKENTLTNKKNKRK